MEARLQAEVRQGGTKSDLKKMRSNGKIPGVVYGKKLGSTSIAVDEKELNQLLRTSPNAVIRMNVPDQGTYPVMVNGVDRDKLVRNILHIDFHQISMDEPVQAKVVIEVSGDAPGVREGGVLTVLLHEVEVRCLPQDIPQSIQADIGSLNVGESLTVGDLPLPDNVELKTDAESVIVTVLVPQKAVEETEAEAEEASAETAQAEGSEESAEDKAE